MLKQVLRDRRRDQGKFLEPGSQFLLVRNFIASKHKLSFYVTYRIAIIEGRKALYDLGQALT